MTPMDPVADVNEMAELLKKSPYTIRKMARIGEIPGFKVGKDWRFIPSEVIDFLTRPRSWHQSNQSIGRKRAQERKEREGVRGKDA